MFVDRPSSPRPWRPSSPRPRLAAMGLCALLAAGGVALATGAGCAPSFAGRPNPHPDLIWSRKGISQGRLLKPRAIAIDRHDHVYVVDMTARIQVFDADGNFLRAWTTPASETGKPSGLSFDRAGNLLVADTHYHRILAYTPEGELLAERTIGGAYGHGPGEFHFVTDAVEDSRGNFYTAEYGDYDRIQKFSPTGEFLCEWGGHGSEPGQFLRPNSLAIDADDRLWIADACNHRIQVFDVSGEEPRLERMWGEKGRQPGQLDYPYDLVLDGAGHVYVAEYGAHRVQKFTLDGRSLAVWGVSGREPGQLNSPWALDRDSRGRLHVVDTLNHRIQRIRL